MHVLINLLLCHSLYVSERGSGQEMPVREYRTLNREGRSGFISALCYDDVQHDGNTYCNHVDKFKFTVPACIYENRSFSKENFEDLVIFSEKVIDNIENNLPTPYYGHIIDKVRKNPQCGLINFNAHCYINAVVQILFSSRRFVKCMRDNMHTCKLLCLLNELYEKMKDCVLVSPLSTYRKISDECNILFNVYERSGYSSDVISTVSSNLEKHAIRTMSIKARQECFWKYPLLDIMDDGNVQERIDKFLKRKPKVEFNDIIVFSGFLTDNMLKCRIADHNIITVKNTKYELLGVLERVPNNCNEYHIIAFAKRNGEWFMFNDEYVLKISADRVLKDKETYYMFYERI